MNGILGRPTVTTALAHMGGHCSQRGQFIPESTTKRIPSMVTEVSAMLVERIHFRTPGGATSNTWGKKKEAQGWIALGAGPMVPECPTGISHPCATADLASSAVLSLLESPKTTTIRPPWAVQGPHPSPGLLFPTNPAAASLWPLLAHSRLHPSHGSPVLLGQSPGTTLGLQAHMAAMKPCTWESP